MYKMKTCPICLEDCKKKNVLILNCSHHYHIDCYTKFVIHQVKEINDLDILDLMEDDFDIKCPMCRAEDFSMTIPLYECMKDGLNAQLNLALFIEEIEDRVIKEFLPHLLAVVNGRRFSKRNMMNVLRTIIKDQEKELKNIIKDLR